ncbi:hypothetical protein ILUMI_04774 [Ignelater luminosus]|uniref:Uncharacterized protein n=1 Tax=Ignelater luminosus TaxID=2038154 RepID=A0A8K0DD77_IGNLU|nr:hypothetical protein ILUMI_04774 [Ignelater luminosus]
MERIENAIEIISISDTESSRSSLISPNPRVAAIRNDLIVQQSTESPIQEEIVTLSSISERCPVTWSDNRKAKQNFLNPDTFFSPSPRSKVSHWLTENAMQYCSQQRIDVETTLDEQLLPNPLDKCTPVSSNKSSIIVRQDYNKQNVESTLSSKLISNQHEKTEANRNNVIYLENSVSSSKQSSDILSKYVVAEISQNNIDLELQKSSNESVVSGNDQTLHDSEQVNIDIEVPPMTPPLSARKLVEDMLNMCTNSEEMNHVTDSDKKVEKPKIKPLDVPLSPETQKKIELCEYLKLMNMNPVDGKTVGMRQNRRSSRVKHLALMSEKRELERKLNTEVQEIEKKEKKSSKSSDGDSKHSSDNDKGSKSSKKINELSSSPTSSSVSTILLPRVLTSQENADESNMKIKASEKRNGSKTPSKLLIEVTNSEKSKVPSKFLQVHEVSTTSISKVRSSNRNSEMKNLEKQMPLRKSDGMHVKQNKNDTPKSSVVTKKSFKELFMDVKNLKQLRNIRQNSCDSSPEDTKLKSKLNFFIKSVSNVPNITCDFDGFIEPLLSEKSKNDKDKTKSINRIVKNKIKDLKRREPPKRKEHSDDGPKAKMRKLNATLKKILKSASSKFKLKKPKDKSSEKSKRPNTRLAKKLKKHKMYGNPKHINKLRSRGRLKQIGIKTVLLKDQKKKYIKKKLKPKLFAFNKEKDFKSTEMIQHGHENVVLVTKEVVETNEVVPPLEVNCDALSTKFGSPNRIKKRLPDPEVWKNFTSEHRKAYIESIKFIKDDGNVFVRNDFSPNKVLFNKESTVKAYNKEESTVAHTEEKDKECDIMSCSFQTSEVCTEQLDRISETHKDIENHANTPALSTFSSVKDKTELSSEDLEVDRLMGSKQVKDQATQKDSESPHTLTNDLVVSGPSRSLSPDPSSSNSWSLQTVQSNSEPIPSTSKQDVLEIPIENSPHIDTEIEINETHSGTPCSTQDSDQDDYENEEGSFPGPGIPEVVNISQIEPARCEYVHLSSSEAEIKSLHHYLTESKRKHKDKSRENSPTNKQNWKEDFASSKLPKSDRKTLSQSHNIYLSNNNGAVINAYYLDHNLIVVQELVVGFWNQSPLGNILGAQDMWISRGNTRRMVLGNGCVNKESPEMVISCNNSVAYIELWTKEHKSDKRERPVADVFVTIYMRLNRNGPDKKVLQLENIKGYASDVQYIVLRSSLCIIVSWTVNADSISSTVVHCYHLSADFQMVSSITEMQSVDHYVSSLHNIEDCDTLILGCGEAKITLWNLEHGYIVATIDLMEIHPRPHAVWAKCDRGFLFTIHQSDDNILQLIAINSFDSTWKRLQTYKPRLNHENFLGVCMEHGVLVAFYDTGISCWGAQTGEQLVEETCEDGVFLPFGKHVVVVLNKQVHVRHALEYLINATEDS